ncbi:MAG: type II toxin-antitoxin system HipA family toxin [Gammaproteobacteria bacterium]
MYGFLPGEARPTLTGQVIVIATGNDGFCRFKYAREWLAAPRAFALDPELLPLADTEFESQPGWEVFSALRDAGPDYWGRKLIERRQNRLALSELEFLLAAGDERTGALAFSTTRIVVPGRTPPSARQLRQLSGAAARIERDEPVSADLLELLGAGTGTIGGMRPKATIEDDGRLWIAKFPSREDRYAITRWESATLELAARCGLDVPRRRLTLVNRRPVLLVARFDRRLHAGVRERAHYLSGLTVLGLHERDYGQGSYADLAHWLRRHGASPREDALELFRRMVFNILIGNSDDHLRNHAVIDFGDGFRLSPLFDVAPMPAAGGQRMQAIAVGREGRLATVTNALSEAGMFGLGEATARAEWQRLAKVVETEWQACFQDAEVSQRELGVVARILARHIQAKA